MKISKNIIKLVIILITIGMIFTSNISKAAVQDIQGKLKVSDATGEEGENVTVKITVTSDIAEDNDSLLLEFDKTKLKYVSSDMANVQNMMVMGGNRENHESGPDGFAIAISSTVADKATIKEGTELAIITFKIMEGTKEDQTLNLVHYKSGVKTNISSGKVIISEFGDIEQIPSEPEEPSKPEKPIIPSEPIPNPGDENNNENNNNQNNNDQNKNEEDKPEQSDNKTNKVVYEMLEGKNLTWKSGKDKNLVFRSSAEFKDFVNVTIDDKVVDKKYYIARSGSTIIELKEEYIKTFKEGTHKISINSKLGSASTNFKIEQEKKEKPKVLPQAGEGINPLVAILFIVLAVNSSIMYLKVRKVNKENN